MKKLLFILIFFFSYTTFSQTAEEYFEIGSEKLENYFELINDTLGTRAGITKLINAQSNYVEAAKLDSSKYWNSSLSRVLILNSLFKILNRNYAEGLRLLDNAIELDSSYYLPYELRAGLTVLMLTKIYEFKDNNEKSIDSLENIFAESIFGQSKSRTHINAISDLNKAIKFDSSNYILYSMRAFSYNYLNDNKATLADYNKIIELDSNNHQTYFLRGLLKKRLQDYEGSLSDYSKALEIDSTNIEVYTLRGIVKDALGDYEGARNDYDTYSRLNSVMKLLGNQKIFPINNYVQIFLDELSEVSIDNENFFAKLKVNYFNDYDLDSDSIYKNSNHFSHPENLISLKYKKGSETNISEKIYNGRSKHNTSYYFLNSFSQTIENNFSHNWNISDYPFDEQILKISFEGNNDIYTMRLLDIPNRFESIPKSKINKINLGLKEGFRAKSITTSLSYKTDSTSFFSTQTKTGTLKSIVDLLPFGFKLQRPIIVPILTFDITIDRSGSWLFIKLFLGSFLGFIISALAFLIPLSEFDPKIELSVGALFVAIGNMYFVEASLPNVMVLTKADLINNLIIIMIIVNILLLIVQRNKKVEWNWYEKGYNPIYFTSSILFLLSALIIIW